MNDSSICFIEWAFCWEKLISLGKCRESSGRLLYFWKQQKKVRKQVSLTDVQTSCLNQHIMIWLYDKQLDMSRSKTSTKGHQCRYPQVSNNGQNCKTRPHPQGNLSSNSTSLVMWFGPPDFSYHWLCCLDLYLSSLKITSRLQLYFSTRPRKATKPNNWWDK